MLRLLTTFLFVELALIAQTDVSTYHNDNGRTGQYRFETLLTPLNVKAGSFGKRMSHVVDGAIYAQPLYMRRVKIDGKGLHNVVFVATAHNSVYAFDADDASGSNAGALWHVSFLDPEKGVTTVPFQDVNCGVIQPELGIIGTPVVDVNSGTIYLIAETKESGNQYVFRLHALDVRNGTERTGSPVVIQPPDFVSRAHKQRGALLLVNGMVYSAWTSHCDRGLYHGWIFAHDATTLSLRGTFNSTPGGNGGSFWNGGAGLSADSDGYIYGVVANGDFDAGAGGSNYGNAVLKLSPAPNLSVAGYFAPFNGDVLNGADLDLGSSGALLLPDEAGSSSHPHLLFTGGKEGRMYLLDRDHLGGAQTGTDVSALASLPFSKNPLLGIGAYINGTIYVGPQYSTLQAFSVAQATLGQAASASATTNTGLIGATPSVSANGTKNSVVWIVSTDENGTLRAYDAVDLKQLYDSNQQTADTIAGYIEFGVPTIADSKVYVGTQYSIEVFGLTNRNPPAVAAVTNAASFATDAVSPGSLISIFGTGLSPVAATASVLPLPISLTDVSVSINGVAAPLLYVSPGQINAQVPFAIATGRATLKVRVSGAESPLTTINVRASAPGVFADETGQSAVLNADGTRNGPGNPAAAQSIVSVFFTGQGSVSSQQDDGAAPAGLVNATGSPISATIGGTSVEIQFAGLAPTYAGLAQMNLRVPVIASGTYPLVISIAGNASKPTTVSVAAP
ncbi:MAG: hypothetical protein ABI693_32155 [Bryobacteraceae bacterium]